MVPVAPYITVTAVFLKHNMRLIFWWRCEVKAPKIFSIFQKILLSWNFFVFVIKDPLGTHTLWESQEQMPPFDKPLLVMMFCFRLVQKWV